MSEVDKLFENCRAVEGLPCDMDVSINQGTDEDDDFFLSAHGRIIYNQHFGEASNSVTFDFVLSPGSDEERYADLTLFIAEGPTSHHRIRYNLEHGMVSRYEQRLSTRIQDRASSNPFGLDEPRETERRETKYTLRALARLAALTTRKMVEQSPAE
jgi:hypothetical protein